MNMSRRVIKELLLRAVLIGPIYLGCSAAVLGLALTLAMMGGQFGWTGGILDLLFFLFGSVVAAALGAAAGYVVFPVAQLMVILLPLKPEQWPAALAVICAGLYFAMAYTFELWMYGSPANVRLRMNGADVLTLVLSVFTGLISGFMFGTAMLKYRERGGSPFVL